MPDLYLITECALPRTVHGSYSRYSLAPLGKAALLEIEDQLFKDGHTIKIQKNSSLVVVPDVSDPSSEEVKQALSTNAFTKVEY